MKYISRIISCMFILSILLPLFTVNAALPSPNPETINLVSSYSSGVSGVNIGQGYQRVLSNYPTLSLNLSLDAGPGNKISQIQFLKYGSVLSTSTVASNTQTQNISTTFSGESKNVISGISGDENATSQGYYSWYRYSNGVYWFADIPPTGQNSSNPSSCGSAIICFGDPGPSNYDTINGTNFWAYPNASSNQLTMSGSKAKPYLLEDSNSTTIPDQYVSNDPANFSASSFLNLSTAPIVGGFGEQGYPESITGTPSTTMSDKSTFKVKFSKNFTSRSTYRGDFSSPGATWMDWFFAFKTTLHSKTFVYPDQIRVTYTQVGVPTLVVTPTTTTIQVGTTTNYVATYTDAAGLSSIVNNSSTWSNNNNTIATISNTGLATGKVDGTVTINAVYSGLTATAELIVTSSATPAPTPTPTPAPPNRPPYVKIAWYKHGDSSETSRVLQNTVVDLKIIFDSTSPFDPDGDPITPLGWDFNTTTWLKGVPSTYGFDTGPMAYQFLNITADTTGSHSVTFTIQDDHGHTYIASATLDVIDPKPIACIDGPSTIKAGRPLPSAITSCSYSPVNATPLAETWTNKLTQYNTPGTEIVKLKVQDTALRWSDETSHNIVVVPDKPPIAILGVSTQTTRNQAIALDGSQSNSPDGDTINRYRFEYQYDAANDGFSNDTWKLLYDGANSSSTLAPTKIGKYNIKLTVWENYGQSGTTSKVTDTLNLAPTVNVQTSGETSPPSTVKAVGMGTVYNSWSLTTTSGTAANKANWVLNNGVMTTKSFSPLGTIRKNFLRGQDDQISDIFSYPSNANGFVYNSPLKLSFPIADSKYIFNGTDHSIDAYDKSYNLVWSTPVLSGSYLGSDNLMLSGNYLVTNEANSTLKRVGIYNKSNGVLKSSIPNAVFMAVVDKYILVTILKLDSTCNCNRTIVSSYDFNGALVTDNIDISPDIFGSGGVLTDGGKTYVSYNYKTRYLTSINLLDGTERWRQPIYSTDNNAYFKLMLDKASGNSFLVYPTALEYTEVAEMRIAVVSNTGALLADNVMNLSQAFGYGTFNRVFWRSGLNMYYESGSIHSYWSNNGRVIHNIYNINGTVTQISDNGGGSSFVYGPYITIGADGTTLHKYEIDDSNFRTQYYRYEVNDPSGNFKYSFIVDKDHPYVASVGDQKLVFFDSWNNAPVIILDTSTLPLPYPKQFTIGEDYDDIWIGGNTISTEIASLTLTPGNVSDEGIGLAFRAQNSTNYLSAEFESGKLHLKKTINGTSSTINEIAYNLVNGSKYRIQVIPSGSTFAIYVNDIFQLSGSDSSWGSGKLGIIDRGQQAASFSSISSQAASGASGSISGVVLINKPVTYNVSFTDPENDPRLTQSETWVYTHNPNVFLNSQGTWSGSGSSYATALSSLPLPGEYSFTFKSKDDPNSAYLYQSMVFDPYRKDSNALTGKIRAHRIPISVYTLGFNPNHTVNWADSSYDPDRYNPSNNTFSSESTGINYQTTRGVLARQYYYVTPSGTTVNSQLIKPAESGTYIVGMAVKDEYNAWSEWNEQTLLVTTPVPNNLPVTNITNIISTNSSSPDILSTLTPNFNWTYSDPDGDPQQRFILNVFNPSNTLVSTSNEVISSTKTYAQATALSENIVYSVQVQAHDGIGYGGLSPKRYFKIITNRPPTGNLTFVTPIYQNDTPSFTITLSDPDLDALTVNVDASFKGGSYTNIKNWTAVPSGTQKIFTYGPLSQGVYTFKLTLNDLKGGTYIQTYTFTALPLGITGNVTHTASWESSRQIWNTLNPTNTRAANVFWAGEAFVLGATVTNTGTSTTKPVSVKASLLATTENRSLTSSNKINFSGEMVNTDFIHSLTDGLYTMRFQIQWSNGMIQTTDVPLQIKGNLFDVLVVQLRN